MRSDYQGRENAKDWRKSIAGLADRTKETVFTYKFGLRMLINISIFQTLKELMLLLKVQKGKLNRSFMSSAFIRILLV